MLRPSDSIMHQYLFNISPSGYRFGTTEKVRSRKINQIARFRITRRLLAIYFILKGEDYIRVLKVDPSRPIRYRKGIWVIRNQSQRADGTIYTSGNAAKVVLVNGEVVYDSTSIFD